MSPDPAITPGFQTKDQTCGLMVEWTGERWVHANGQTYRHLINPAYWPGRPEAADPQPDPPEERFRSEAGLWEVQPNVSCVACPSCAFTFAAEHTDPDDGYSCPNCGENGGVAVPPADDLRCRTVATHDPAMRCALPDGHAGPHHDLTTALAIQEADAAEAAQAEEDRRAVAVPADRPATRLGVLAAEWEAQAEETADDGDTASQAETFVLRACATALRDALGDPRPAAAEATCRNCMGVDPSSCLVCQPSDRKTRGLYGKYQVERNDGKPLKGGRCIVLEVGDQRTHPALRTWAQTVRAAGYEALADDVEAMLGRLASSGPCTICGDPGRWIRGVGDVSGFWSHAERQPEDNHRFAPTVADPRPAEEGR